MAYNAMGLANGDGSVTVYGNSSSSGGGGGTTASAVSYDNSTSGLSATNVQEAIDALATSSAGGSVVNIITDTDWFHGKVVTLTGTYDTYQATLDNNGHAQVRVFYNDTYDVECEDFHNSLIVTEMGAVYTVGIDEDYAIVTITAYDTDEMKNKSIIIKLGDMVKATPTFDDNGVLTFKATKVDTYTIYYTDENDVTRLPQNFEVEELNITMSITYYHIIPKTFAAATDSEVIAMVAAADEGYCDLYDDCGWRVGQEHGSWVLLHKGLYELVTPVLNKDFTSRNTCSFVCGYKECYASGKMNGSSYNTATNSGSWDSSAGRTWCNTTFKNNAVGNLLPIFKEFKTITAREYNSSDIKVSNDYFALCAEKEIYGTTKYCNTVENDVLTQFTYYENTSNRRKKYNNSYVIHWHRSPAGRATFKTEAFTVTTRDGDDYNEISNGVYSNETHIIYFSPFGCI